MRTFRNQVAIVTGATSGIGRAIALRLADEGMYVCVTGRRRDKLKELEECKEAQNRIYAFACDMSREKDVVDFFALVRERFRALHVLVNNAGTAFFTRVADGRMDRWRDMFEVNVYGVGVASREALQLMNESSIDDGYIINISSISAHAVPLMTGKHIYNASKHALRVITEGLRAELAEIGSGIRVSMISPGSVATEIAVVGGWLGAYQSDRPVPVLEPEDIADTVMYLLNLPPKVQVTDMIVRPTGETILA